MTEETNVPVEEVEETVEETDEVLVPVELPAEEEVTEDEDTGHA